MNSVIVACLVASLAVYSHAGLLGLGGRATLVGPGNPGALIKGPAAEGVLLGPDGSHIAAAAQAGIVDAAPIPGGVVSAAVAPGRIAIGHGGLLGGGLLLGLH
ncbi:uncharacterized protein LOC132696800 [Cylas formicarius]|uniref:uncharacterized protein LOC132696800 n=1 Tax=Cylas formicarius TaxID=197179 RepID=UPI002958A992|nr:uncharacterized protein LOC132696800 [Cylas formicarius]